MPWQQHQATSVRPVFSEDRRVQEEKRDERLPLFLPRQTCGVAAELSRGHTTHIASAHIHCCTDWNPPPPHPPLHLSLTLHHLHVNFSPGCHLPTQSSISLSVCLAGRINGLSLEQVLILLRCTRLGPPDWNILLHQYHWPILKRVFAFVNFVTTLCLWNPQGWLRSFSGKPLC